jgi:hypothetical protein
VLVVLLVAVACSGTDWSSPSGRDGTTTAAVPRSDGPLVGISKTMFFQSHITGDSPMFFGGNLGLFNDAAHAVTVVAVVGWGEVAMRYEDADYILADDVKPLYDGFDGATGKKSLAEAAVGFRGWEHMAPLVGAELPPCCAYQIFVGIQAMPVAGAASGRLRGLTITYRTADGREWVTNAPAAMGFCAGALDDPPCKDWSKQVNDLSDADGRATPDFDDLNKPNTWHG